jgi:valyl-tRNA synthetase
MDKNLSAAVAETFVRLHKEGLIYRDKRIVRWCPALQTVLSDSEVEDLSLDGRKLLSVPGHDKKVEFGVITYFKYPVLDSSDYIEVATTRPE